MITMNVDDKNNNSKINNDECMYNDHNNDNNNNNNNKQIKNDECMDVLSGAVSHLVWRHMAPANQCQHFFLHHTSDDDREDDHEEHRVFAVFGAQPFSPCPTKVSKRCKKLFSIYKRKAGIGTHINVF